MEALTKAREKRGWSYPEAAVRLGMTSQSLRNLERIGHTRPTIPGNATVFTMVRILETFDELDIGDFVAGTELSVRSVRGSQVEGREGLCANLSCQAPVVESDFCLAHTIGPAT